MAKERGNGAHQLTSKDLGKLTLLYVAQIPSVDPIGGPTHGHGVPSPPAAFAVFLHNEYHHFHCCRK